jgi:UDP-glucose 4-epimerase
MKNVAITGVSGYIGTRLLLRLDNVDEVEKIAGIDIRPPKYNPDKLVFYHRDITSPLGDIFADNKVDTAIHLAFVVKPSHNRKRSHDIDVGGTMNFIKACEKAKVEHILYPGSHTVYGAHADNTRSLTEDSPLRPLRTFQYSWDKAEAERMYTDFSISHKDICVTVLRSCPVIGPNAAGSVISSMFQPVMIRIAGYDPLLQFVHEDDLVELIITILKQKKSGIFNVAGDGHVRYGDIAGLCGKRTISLPDWLLQIILSFSWHLRLQGDSPPSGLEFIKYPPLVNTDRLKK